MILTENRAFLATRFPEVLTILEHYQENPINTLNIQRIDTKSSLPTLSAVIDGHTVFIHSKYDPVAEAEKLIASYTNIEHYRHVIFYGTGMGYHIAECMKKHPGLEYTIIEPSLAILSEYLSYQSLKDLPIDSLQHLMIDISPKMTEQFLFKFLGNRKGEVLLVILPSYERVLNEACRRFVQSFTEAVNSKRLNMQTSLVYQQKWTTNCLRNLPKLIHTPSFLQAAGDSFRGKPAIIVAAGPSVMDDLENLRRIKDERLAYIFAAGSGLHPLLNAGIIPDAICSYDPNDNNPVFKPVFEKNITSLPLIFGSSVGFTKLDEYPGPKLHFLLNQDPLASFYLKRRDGEPLRFISDHPTISGVIFQLLYHLGCNPIVFTGQNLGFRNNLTYAPGIDYYNPQLTEEKLKDTFPVEDVYGGQMLTNLSYKMMRDNLEMLISLCPDREVINATKGGAKISGTSFVPLEDLIGKRWDKPVVSTDWQTCGEEAYDRAHLAEQLRIMEAEHQAFQKIFKQMVRMVKDLPDPRIKGNQLSANAALVEVNKKFKKLTGNLFFNIYIVPQRQVELDVLNQKIGENEFVTDTVVKVGQLLDLIAQFILRCQPVVKAVEPVYQRVHEILCQEFKAGPDKNQ